MKFAYTTTKTFDRPGPNQPKGAITTYYKQTRLESVKVLQYCKQTRDEVIGTMHESQEFKELMTTPDKKNYPKAGRQSGYTRLEIIEDMIKQLESGKDIPSGMLGRWNKVFELIPQYKIEMSQTRDSGDDSINIFSTLFGQPAA